MNVFSPNAIRGFRILQTNKLFLLARHSLPRSDVGIRCRAFIYGWCMLLASYLMYRSALMDGSKRGYANLCSRRQLLPTYKRLCTLRISLSLFDSSATLRDGRDSPFCRDEFCVLIILCYFKNSYTFLNYYIKLLYHILGVSKKSHLKTKFMTDM